MREEIIDICRGHESLDSSISEKLMALGETSTEELINVATDIELLNVDSVGGGFIPVIAAQELTKRKDPSAIVPLLSVVKELDVLDMVMEDYRDCLISLTTIENLERIIKTYSSEECDEDFKYSIAIILGESKIKDERIFSILINELKKNTIMAGYLSDYGNRDAIPYLMEKLDSLKVSEDNSFLNFELFDLESAILELGGTLTDFQKNKMETAHKASQNFRTRFQKVINSSSKLKKVGRNDPCSCGSGKKYKKCCLLN